MYSLPTFCKITPTQLKQQLVQPKYYFSAIVQSLFRFFRQSSIKILGFRVRGQEEPSDLDIRANHIGTSGLLLLLLKRLQRDAKHQSKIETIYLTDEITGRCSCGSLYQHPLVFYQFRMVWLCDMTKNPVAHKTAPVTSIYIFHLSIQRKSGLSS